MKKKLEDYDLHANCPIRNVLDRFGDKWSILVILLLGEHKTAMRFNEVAQTIGDISLRTLEADGMVVRKHYPEIPPRVEYELTDLGKSLLPHINGLAQWAVKNYDAITKSRKKFAARKQLVS